MFLRTLLVPMDDKLKKFIHFTIQLNHLKKITK